MERFIQLNLRDDGARAETANFSKTGNKEPVVPGKTLNQMANRAAHKAARAFARGGSGIFSK